MMLIPFMTISLSKLASERVAL